MTPRVEIARSEEGGYVAIVREPEIRDELDARDLRELALALLDAAATIDALEHPS